MTFSTGMTVRSRGQRCVVVEASPVVGGEAPSHRVRLRALEGPLRGQEWPVIDTLEGDLNPEELPPLALDRVGRDARFRLLHDAFQLTLAPPPTTLLAAGRSRISFHLYQQIPALRMLSLPRPRILNASDVGLGKTIETGIALRELIARRRGGRILIVCPAGIMEQWQDELATKFGLEFQIFDRDGVHEAKKQIELGGNAWATEPRIIASFDYLKRRDGVFREVQNVRFNVIVCDECHHLADNTLTDEVSDRHRLAQWVSKASDALILLSATPHSGYDESFASLLNLLEPTLVPEVRNIRYHNYAHHLIRHLKRHIKNADGTGFFVPAKPSKAIPLTLTSHEAAVHAAVARQAGVLDEQAELQKNARDKYALRLVATILRKRASSSLAALRSTVTRRLENLEKAAEDVEVRRDHLRALRKGETIPDEALSQLELDAHRSFLARIRAAGKKLRTIEQETQDLLDLQTLLATCPTETDSKAEALLGELMAIHATHPTDKVIVFSEYADTVEWLVGFLKRHGYEDKLVQYDGTLTGPQRKRALADFAKPETLLLVSTDSAAEGLNLQTHCHRVAHVELPFNPNRMLQRQGRVDRFGQTEECEFAFLYAKDTYEGEVLKRLLDKIERQVRSVGSVGDVLGALQVDHIERLISQSPHDVGAAIEEADRWIEEELARVNNVRNKDLMGDDGLNESEVCSLQTAIEAGNRINVDPVGFVERAVALAGGRCQRENGLLRVPQVPTSWIGGKVPQQYEALYTGLASAPSFAKPGDVIDDEHPLVQNAIRWVRESRYKPDDDHRMAARLLEGIDAPDIVATFIATVRANDNTEMQRLLTIRVGADGTADLADAFELLAGRGVGNVPPERLTALFGGWWETARQRAEEEATGRARRWRDEVKQKRHVEAFDLRTKLDEWNRATRAVILHRHEFDPAQTLLFGMEKELPPAIKRRLREHDREYEEHATFLNRRLEFDSPTVEPLGVLLRVPSREGR
ncbi:MAG: DEAD/DEAH box helicase [Phycisphaerales bacterium]|nr:DEAD/DEAH box helicase [Phycisphaerales bacterium]